MKQLIPLPHAAITFLELLDTPSTYSGQGGKFIRISAGGGALEFVDHVGAADPHAGYVLESAHTKAAHDALGIDADLVDGSHAAAFEAAGAVAGHVGGADPHTGYVLESAHTKAAHDALAIDADLLDGSHAAAFEAAGAVTTHAGLANPHPSALIQIASYAASQTLTDAECRGYLILVTAAATITLPVAIAGYIVTVYSTAAAAVSVDPDVTDRIILDGVAGGNGKKITSASGAGDFVTLVADSAAGWTVIGRSGTWTMEA